MASTFRYLYPTLGNLALIGSYTSFPREEEVLTHLFPPLLYSYENKK